MKKFKFLNIKKNFFFNKLFSKFKRGIYNKTQTNEIATNQEQLDNIPDYSQTKLHKELVKHENSNLDTINKKYELYKGYEVKDILQKDEEFGDIIKYEYFLEEGKDKIENTLTKYYNENQQLEKNKEYQNLMQIIDNKSKQLYSTYKEEYKYDLEKTDEKWYKETVYSRKANDTDQLFRSEHIKTKRKSTFRNFKEEIMVAEELSKLPDHPTYITKVSTPFESYVDYFQWLYNEGSKDYTKFINSEDNYTFYALMKYKYLQINIQEEFEEDNVISPLCSMQISKNYLVFKKSQEDSSIYFVDANSVEPSNRGLVRLKEYEEKEVFGLGDFVELNTKYTDVGFIDFTKRLLDQIEIDVNCLVHFKLCPKEKYLMLFFDMGGGDGYDIMIKDVKNNVLLPVIIHNANIDIAFDKHEGLYYTQFDMTKRWNKVFRHQIGRAKKYDTLIYHEKNQNFEVRTFNCNSMEYIYIDISTTTKPGFNEVWFKPASDLDKVDFHCIKKMEVNINYNIKFANGSFYMLTNKYDTYDKSLKKIHINDPNIKGYLEYTKLKTEETELVTKNDLTDLDLYTETLKNTKLPLIQDLVKVEDNINIIRYEVFKNFLVVLEEVNKIRQFKIHNLISGVVYTHEPALENMNVKLTDNYAYESSYFRYTSSSMTIPETTTDYSMGTRKQYDIHQMQFRKYTPSKYKTETMYITDRSDEVKIPVVISYKEDYFSTESPYILYTKGSLSDKSELEFNDLRVKLLDRGFVFAIPQIRGTRFFDFDWYAQGIADNKIKHFTDLIDVSSYLVDNGITNKLILYGDGYSGGLTTSIAMIQNPDLYSLQIFNNPAFDVFDLCMNSNKNIDLIEEFGDTNVRQFYEIMKLYSPYQSKLPDLHAPILITIDETDKNKTQAFKFLAKLRKKNKLTRARNDSYLNIFKSDETIEQKIAFIYSFIIGQTLLKK